LAVAKRKRQAAPALEWIAAAVGLVLLGFILVVIGREAVTGETEKAPEIEIVVRRIVPNAAGFVVEFEAINRSAATAAGVDVEGTLGDETSTTTLDYVPGGGRARGGLFFRGDPRAGVDLRALGYRDP
jgi:uncharacterized protein (TIGR02588 family)